MPAPQERLGKLGRAVLIVANILVTLVLILTAGLIWLERGWVKPQLSRAPEDAFRYGTIGTELLPLPVALVLPDMFPDEFLPAGGKTDEWVEQFGFVRDPGSNDGLPVGFVTSNYRPGSGSPSPVAFVGFACALCHSSALHDSDGKLIKLVYGPGSISLNLFAWLDAFQTAMLEPLAAGTSPDPAKPPPYKMTLKLIEEKYQEKAKKSLSVLEKGMIALWLRQIRKRLNDGLPRFDDSYGHGRSRDPELVPTGPTRTQPFRTLIRNVFDRPGNDMPVYTKIATVFSEDLRTWSQFDGTIANLDARSSLEPAHRGRGVELLGHRDKGDTMGIEQLNQLGKIRQRPRQAIDLVDDNDIDLAGTDVVEELLQVGAFSGPPRVSAVIISGPDQGPSGVGLAFDVGGGSLILRI
jgi:hypothetical protein